MRVRAFLTVTCLFAAAATSFGQEALAYRARFTAEAGSVKVADRRRESVLAVASADATWEHSRLKLGAGVVAASASNERTSLVAREGYGRLSAASWLDLEAGKRLQRWGVGYGFAPTGVLDPPRDPADPTDRFGRREGVMLARADIYAGSGSFTAAAARIDGHPVAAMRAKLLMRGLDVSVIAAAKEGDRGSYGASVTHVVGDRLEWHAEAIVHDEPRGPGRTISAAAGAQYTASGMNLVLEYHRRENGNVLFGRAGRADTEARFQPELIVTRPVAAARWTTVASLSARIAARVQAYFRVTEAPGVRAVATGITARF